MSVSEMENISNSNHEEGQHAAQRQSRATPGAVRGRPVATERMWGTRPDGWEFEEDGTLRYRENVEEAKRVWREEHMRKQNVE
mmetsp:Transcript_10849/g.21813  ORF Transcript_10849/g.21813 Transcript_10849/m.21813 type:complete len:83 (+) Transcript_10849:92-340(+)|eukprot:CAMPEP_0181293976 /NCGR_PEP_ID=MMETSP1101-20121128/3350_1 /TAXON_ID=46948 /ORGANISM="Rhodomonas abbreviata, Strain Caron Lab Isolate" /LENGTH=82 /DNA_ID=CAMNT_0023398595 /DNA_START=195 /DNA_END=443 /DNA_ORIENTATION=+